VGAELLLDTGALVSLLDRTEVHHDACRRFLDGWEGAIVSTEAVLTESTYLMGRIPGGRAAAIDMFLSGGATLLPLTRAMLRRAHALIEQYADLPMDFADATLVVLAEELDANQVFTTDRRDFEIYRIHGRRRFRIVPDSRAPT